MHVPRIGPLVNFSLQKTYAKVPAVGESHLHVMNSLDCPVFVNISGSGLSRSLDINSSSNHILYDLGPML
jgi:hypothetical protein